jgi:hypothetical protein
MTQEHPEPQELRQLGAEYAEEKGYTSPDEEALGAAVHMEESINGSDYFGLESFADYLANTEIDTEKVAEYKGRMGGEPLGVSEKAQERIEEVEEKMSRYEAQSSIWEGMFRSAAADKRQALTEIKDILEALDDMPSGGSTPAVFTGGGFMNPTYNFGVIGSLDPDLGASMSPTYNFGSIGDGEDLPETEPVPDMGEPTVYNPQIAVSPGANVDINMSGTEGGTAEAGGSGLDGSWEPEFDIGLENDSGGGPDVDASGGSGISGAAS